MRRVALAAALVAGCGPASDHFGIEFTLDVGASDQCPSPLCTQIKVSCDLVVSVRVVDASDPSTVYMSKCLPVQNAENLCALSSIDLSGNGVPSAIPNRMVRVEVAVWPAYEVPDLMCPSDVQFDVRGLPGNVSTPSGADAPAIGGASYFLAGSGDTATVNLGCVDTSELDSNKCGPAGTVKVTAKVNDFDTDVSLPKSLADTVAVGVGEPKSHINPTTQQIEWDLASADITPLPLDTEPTIPAWTNPDVPVFQHVACVQVLEDGPQETPAITCHAAAPTDTIEDLLSFRLAKSTLAEAFNALRLPGVPDSGLVVGMVVDENGSPVTGATVTTSAGNVRFLNADRTALDPGNVTTTSGMFVSRDVPFDATWSVSDSHGNGPAPGNPIVGGLVVGKATVIYVQLAPPQNGG